MRNTCVTNYPNTNEKINEKYFCNSSHGAHSRSAPLRWGEIHIICEGGGERRAESVHFWIVNGTSGETSSDLPHIL